MKKNLHHFGLFRSKCNCHKIVLTIKISAFLLFCCGLNIFAAPTYSEVTKLSLNLNDATIGEVPNSSSIASSEPQQNLITGKITDENGAPLPGVNIKVEGTTVGSISDVAGNYSITVPDNNAVIIFSFVGYKTENVSVAGRKIIDIALVPSLASLNEVVVIGYGTQKRIEVTSSVANVKSEEFIKGSVKDAGQLLQGKVAGLSVSTISGDPTAPSQLVLRGTATLSTSTQPLILIDGIPGDLNTCCPGRY